MLEVFIMSQEPTIIVVFKKNAPKQVSVGHGEFRKRFKNTKTFSFAANEQQCKIMENTGYFELKAENSGE